MLGILLVMATSQLHTDLTETNVAEVQPLTLARSGAECASNEVV